MTSANKLTNAAVDTRLSDRTVCRVGSYVTGRTKIEFGCSVCAHVWGAAPSDVLQGKGCPSCAGNIRHTNEVVDARLADRSVYRIGEYVNNRAKIEFGCSVCAYTWMTSPSSVLGGSGCPSCADTLLTNEVVDARLSDRTVYRVGDYANNRTKIEFGCSVCAHTWAATPANILHGTGCPGCAGQSPLTNEIVDARITDRTVYRIGNYVNTDTKIDFGCSVCSYTWMVVPYSVLRGYGCPSCSGQVPLTNEVVDARIADRTVYRIGSYVDTRTKIEFGCSACAHAWMAAPQHILRGSGCPPCGGALPLTNEILDGRLADRSVYRVGECRNATTKIEFGCSVCAHIWVTAPSHIVRGTGCPACAGQIILTNEVVDARLADRALYRIGDYVDALTKIEFGCSVCPHTWMSKPHNIFFGTGCPGCAEYGFNPAKPAILYLLRVGHLNKIGVTNHNVIGGKNARFSSAVAKRHDMEVLFELAFDVGQDAYDAEQAILKHYAEHRYTGDPVLPPSVGGNTELFSVDLRDVC